MFSTSYEYVIVSAEDSGILFTAAAQDEDILDTCRQDESLCPCGRIRYNLIAGNDAGLFKLDTEAGYLYVVPGSTLQPGKEYVLVIEANSVVGNNDTGFELHEAQQSGGTQQVSIQVRHSFEDEFGGDEETILQRQRRAAAGSGFSNDTVINLVQQVTPTSNDTYATIAEQKFFTVKSIQFRNRFYRCYVTNNS